MISMYSILKLKELLIMTDNGQYLQYGIIKWDYICLSVIKVLYLMALPIA